MNCLQYALGFWLLNKEYDIFYNSDHVINLDTSVVDFTPPKGYLSLRDYGYEHVVESFGHLLCAVDMKRLRDYFSR